MSGPINPINPTDPYPYPSLTVPPTPAPPVKSNRKRNIIIAGGVVLALCCMGSIVSLVKGVSDGVEAVSPPAQATTAAQSAPKPRTSTKEAPPPPPPAPVYLAPTVADFEVTFEVTEKDCFGSAGCLVHVEPALNYLGEGLDPAGNYRITYEVIGSEDPMIESIEVDGTGHYSVREMIVSTPNVNTVPKANVTSVKKIS